MKHPLNYVVALCLMLVMMSASAVSASDQLSQRLERIDTLSSPFKQTLFNTKGQAMDTQEGRMALKRPGLFYWHVTSPIAQTIIADGERLWVYDIELEQVTVQSLVGDTSQRPAMLLTQDPKSFLQAYSVEKLKQSDPGDWYILTPKNAGGQFTWLQLYFERGKLKKILFEDNLGGQSLIDLKKPAINQPLDKTLFEFELPPNVDVVQT